MNGPWSSRLLTDLTPAEVAEYLERDQRMIVPVGACDQYGPHLPIGAASLVAESFARRLSDEFDVLWAPTMPYGVNVLSDEDYAGAASLREKTLHSMLNDILACWEDAGFREFLLLTVHDFDSHVEALANVTLAEGRVRVLEVVNMDLSDFLDGETGPDHGGETLTSLMLHLYPDRVRMDRAVDFMPDDRVVSTLRRLPRIPERSPGSMGRPSLASAEKGKRIFDHIYEKLRTRVFLQEEN